MSVSIKQCCALSRCAMTQNLKACSACSEVLYCCKEHQVEHFKEGGHKLVCPGKAKDPSKKPPLSFATCNEKAQKYYTEENWEAALPYYSAMLELTARPLGLFHFQVANCLQLIGNCYRNLKKFEEATQIFQRMIVIREVNNDGSEEKSKELFNCMGSLAELYMEMGQIVVARDLMKKVEEAAKESFGEASFERGRAMNALATCLEMNSEVEEAETVLREALKLKGFTGCSEISQKVVLSSAYFNLGVLLLNLEKGPESVVNFKLSLAVKKDCGINDEDDSVIEVRSYLTRAEELK